MLIHRLSYALQHASDRVEPPGQRCGEGHILPQEPELLLRGAPADSIPNRMVPGGPDFSLRTGVIHEGLRHLAQLLEWS